MIKYEDVKNNETIKLYIRKSDETLAALGYTDHSLAHVSKVAEVAGYILETLGYSEREVELVKIASYLHDMGNLVNREEHAQSGACMAFKLLSDLGAAPEDIAVIVSAIGNHDEHTAVPVSPVAAAVILADKSDVRRSRVRNQDLATFDIHDRVNYAVENSEVTIDSELKSFQIRLKIDTSISPVIDYFEIFLDRMILCKRAAEYLDLTFELIMNNQRVL